MRLEWRRNLCGDGIGMEVERDCGGLRVEVRNRSGGGNGVVVELEWRRICSGGGNGIWGEEAFTQVNSSNDD